MVITTSASATASAPLSNTLAPFSAAARAAAATGSNPRTACPAATRLAAMGPPMLPRPRNATVLLIGEPLLCLLCRRPRAGRRGATDDDAHALVGAFQDPVHPQIPDDLLEPVLAQVPVPAVQLQGLIGDTE